MTNHIDIQKAGGVIIRDRKFLVTRSAGKDFFIAPGGKLENNETPQEALKRELSEEIQIDININTLEDVGTFYADAAGKDGIKLEMYVFKVNDYEGEPTPSSEVEEIRWISTLTQDIQLGSIFEHDVMPLLKESNLID
ncbi:MAG: NUDIX domain-containing protein [Patescibacteria group bacterium]